MLALSAVALILGTVQLEGGSSCPSPADVQVRLTPMLSQGPSPVARRAVLQREGAVLRVQLYEGDALVGERQLPARGACRALADATAVILAAWLSDLDASLPPPALPQPDAPVEPPRGRVLRPAPVEPGPVRALTAFAGVSVALGEGGPSLGGLAGLSVASVDGGWGLVLAAHAFGHRQVTSSTVRVLVGEPPRYELISYQQRQWERFGGTLGPLYRLRLGSAAIDFQLEAALASLSLQEERAGTPTDLTVPDIGASAAVRLCSPVGLWLEARGVAWPLAGARGLAPVELLLSAGAGWGTP